MSKWDFDDYGRSLTKSQPSPRHVSGCTPERPCGGAAYVLDVTHARLMAAYGSVSRLYRCINGHTHYPDTPVPPTLQAAPTRNTPRGARLRRRPPCIVCGDEMVGEYITRVRHARCDAEGRRRYQTIFNQRRRVKRVTARERGKATGGGVKRAHELAMGSLGR